MFLFIALSCSLSAQTQSWQWVKAGGSNSDNGSASPAVCKIAGCDTKGNVYGLGTLNGSNIAFDTFSITNTDIQAYSFLLFSYNCAGNMRWAKQIGSSEGNYGMSAISDVYGNTYITTNFYYGVGNCNNLNVYLGDSIIHSTSPTLCQPYLCLVKYDSLGKLIWFKNLEVDTVYHPGRTDPYGLRIGSSGHLWIACYMDSNYAISSNLHTSKKGRYNVEVDPVSGNILSGYYLAQNVIFGNSDDVDTYWDLDKDENFYETGTLNSYGGSNGDVLILNNQNITVDSAQTYVKPYIYSLDKHGNFRYIITNRSYVDNGYFRSCKYDLQSDRLIICWSLNPSNVYGTDTFAFNPQNIRGSINTRGLFSINTNGNILWGKYQTWSNSDHSGLFTYVPTPFYADHIINNGLTIYNNADTLFNKDTTASIYDYTKIVSRIDKDGNMIATHSAHVGNVGSSLGDNMIRYGATDWRGNVYLGGTVTNYFATPADSVVNTDLASGNFFIAKLGVSDCSCPTPGTEFTQTAIRDSVHFLGTSVNHRDSIHWEFGDGTFSNADTSWHHYNADGTYTVTAIGYSGCGIDSITKQVTVSSVGIKVVEPDKTNLYPNPVKSTANLQVSDAATIGFISANGTMLWDSPRQVSQSGTYVFDMNKYSSGLYYFIVEYTNGKVDVLQVVKE
jgi:hypothetical protein